MELGSQKTILWHKSKGSIITFYLFLSIKTIDSTCL